MSIAYILYVYGMCTYICIYVVMNFYDSHPCFLVEPSSWQFAACLWCCPLCPWALVQVYANVMYNGPRVDSDKEPASLSAVYLCKCVSQELAHWNPLSSKHACRWPEWLQSHNLIRCLQNPCLQKDKAFSLASWFHSNHPTNDRPFMAFLSDPRSFLNSSSLLHASRSEMVFLFRFMDVMAGCVGSKCARNFGNKCYVRSNNSPISKVKRLVLC